MAAESFLWHDSVFWGLLQSKHRLEPCEVPHFLNSRAPGSVQCPSHLKEKLVSTSGWPGWFAGRLAPAPTRCFVLGLALLSP